MENNPKSTKNAINWYKIIFNELRPAIEPLNLIMVMYNLKNPLHNL